MPFRCIVADPAWSFGDKLPGKRRGAARNYRVMTVEDICAIDLPPLAPDAYLFLWRVSSQVEEAYRVVRAWGFVPKSEIVWEKLTKRGKAWFGMGRHVRAAHETCIVAVRGKPQRLAKNVRSRFAARVPLDAAGKYIHSAKPDEFFDLVERLAPGPRLELFARRQRAKWIGLGNEMPHATELSRRAA